MKLFRFLAVTAFACVMAGLSAHESRAEQKLCVNASTGASRVIDAETRCSKAETAVVIAGATKGETVVASSYIVANIPNHYLSVITADNGAELNIYCSGNAVGWFALDPAVSAGDVNIFNAVSGQPFQAFRDLTYNGGFMDAAVVTERPWTGVFTYRNKQAMSRFEVTVSEVNKRRDCLVTLFSIGLASAKVVKSVPCRNRRWVCAPGQAADPDAAAAP